MSAPLLTLKEITHAFGGEPLLGAVDLVVGRGDRLGLVGRNGSGKSTLLQIAAGALRPDAGDRMVQPGARVAYVPQEPRMSGHDTVHAYVAAGLRDGEAHEAWRADAVLDGIGLDGDRPLEPMSGGERRRAVLARALVGRPDVLLLDEPTNHLDLPTIEWLEERLAALRGGLVVISHDRMFLERLTNGTLWLDRGTLRRLERGFGAFDEWAEEVLDKEAAELERLDQQIARETAWARRGMKARRRRNQGRLRKLQALRSERAQVRARQGGARLELEAGDLSGKMVVEASHVAKSFGDLVILRDFSTRILRGDRVGIIGRNGAGKTTLLRLLTGELEPDAGTIRLGTNLTPTFLDQHRSILDPEQTLWETLCEAGGDQVMVRGEPKHVVGYLQDFLFRPDQARAPVSTLSGGERNRLVLAKCLARPSNLLVMDEPTNDLDMETLDLLQEVLSDYDGTLLLVSHDRDFLDRVVTSTIVLDGSGDAVEYAGGYSDYVRQRELEAAERAAEEEERRSKPAGEKPKTRPKPRTKLSYKQSRELEALGERVPALEREIADLEARLEDPELYSHDPDAFQAAVDRREEAREELAASEERWLELEMLREEYEARRSGQ
ncbi:MAG: ABC-F family ATP-binding cassette domain-containing protein [Myxococcota bacterium]